jgi:hypothetical protein
MDEQRQITPIAEVASEGGKARAESLTQEERIKIAKKAADARWSILKATHGSPDSPLRIGEIEIPCYVLEDGTRVLTQAGFLEALGRHRKARVRNREGEDPLPAMIQGKSINRFISKDLVEKSRPIIFRTPDGVRAKGYQAEILPEVCEVYLKARDADELPPNQQHVAKQAEILVRGLAHVGIIALVDEATGYQEIRDRIALQEILNKYLRKEFAAWASQFPAEFYHQIFRLRGWEWKGMKVNRPQCVASYTKDLVYARLAPGILKELEVRNPVQENGRRKSPMYWWLTEDVGHPALAQHLHAVVGLMKAADSWEQLIKMVNRAFPRRDDLSDYPLFKDLDDV